MIARVHLPIRALILSFAFSASLFIFIPTPSRAKFSFTERQAYNPTATETSKISCPVKVPHTMRARILPNGLWTVRLRRPKLIPSEILAMTLLREGPRVRQDIMIPPKIRI